MASVAGVMLLLPLTGTLPLHAPLAVHAVAWLLVQLKLVLSPLSILLLAALVGAYHLGRRYMRARREEIG